MLSEIRRKKLEYLFAILDVNHSGHVDAEDIQLFVNLLAEARYYSKDSLAYLALSHAYMRLWAALAAQIDHDDDGSITLAEWLTFFDRMTDSFHEDFIVPIQRTMVSLLDVDGDDSIRLSDYYALARACRLSRDDIEDVFKKIDTNGDGVLSPDEAGQALSQFFASDDPNASGNWFFGDYNRA